MNKVQQILPRLTEKTYQLSNDRVYVVSVNNSTNRLMIKQAIENQFTVKVNKVNIVNVKGKAKRTISKNGRRVSKGQTSDFKKAYVTLAEGNSLPFFSVIEEEEKQAEKVQKEVLKQQEKEDKKRKKPAKESK